MKLYLKIDFLELLVTSGSLTDAEIEKVRGISDDEDIGNNGDWKQKRLLKL